ncbi:MAG: hypothetical protein ABEJ28_03630 [Salinigranum sp.]
MDRSRRWGQGDDLPTEVDGSVFRALADRRRRLVVYHLLDRERASIDEVVEALLGRLDGETDETGVRVSLRHVHLPKLADAGLVSLEDDLVLADFDGPAESLVGRIREVDPVAPE